MPAIPSVNHIFASAQLGSRDATQERSIPVGAMVGGLVGGAVLAILVTAGWLLWARAIRRSRAQREKEVVDAQQRTKSNTRYNASAALGQPWAEGYRPTLLRPPETRVKFTEKSRTPSAPKALRSAKMVSEQQQTQVRVPRLPSTVSSVSLYSAESAEEHQIRVPTSLLAALGSVEAVLTRGSWGDHRPLYRASQATSGSAYSQDVGVAY
ncbi:hypothetical protein B0H17DRAFT_1330044 [Mycena rosella]|uniref:Uncharacterized protein n=1 Tax=Mycena rosella TaxID=1033263 RepID=A0AAD7DM90_MYCRO|nr:hypothetical protein B0H17DRAFT_1330044 [Mycena rosella]